MSSQKMAIFSQQLVGGVVEQQPEIHGISQLFGWLAEKPSLDRSESKFQWKCHQFFFWGVDSKLMLKMLLVTVIVIGVSLIISSWF